MKTKSLHAMIRMVFGLALLLVSAYGHASSSVWEISRGGHHLYLGGTIHVLAKQDWPIPEAYDRAYGHATVIVFETDLGAMNKPEVALSMLEAMSLEPPQTLKSLLDPDTYDAVKRYFEQHDIPMEQMNGYKPGMVSMTMSMMELEELDQVGEGVDEHYYARALKDHKELGKLEEVEAQIRFLAEMGQGQENELLRQTLEDLKELPETMAAMKQAWRNGDGDEVEKLMIVPMRQQTPQVYQSLLLARNRAWLPKIEAMLKTEEVEFVMVGAAHLVGEEGLIAQLARLGYRVRQLD